MRREDYRPPAWLVPEIALDVALDPAATRVRATLQVRRNGTDTRMDVEELPELFETHAVLGDFVRGFDLDCLR